jgi:hypothetical protein
LIDLQKQMAALPSDCDPKYNKDQMIVLRCAGIPCIARIQVINDFLTHRLNASSNDGGHINSKANDCTRQYDPINGHCTGLVIFERCEDRQKIHMRYSFQWLYNSYEFYSVTNNFAILAAKQICKSNGRQSWFNLGKLARKWRKAASVWKQTGRIL